jgi:8-oxo-dGTP diphosphatase
MDKENKMIKVVCGIIYKDGKIFIARRKPHKSMGGLWEFPGGKIEEGEEYADSLKRELQEELEMQVEVNDFLMENIHNYDTFIIQLIALNCEYISAKMKLADHDQFKWVSPNKLLSFELAPADIPIAEMIANN